MSVYAPDPYRRRSVRPPNNSIAPVAPIVAPPPMQQPSFPSMPSFGGGDNPFTAILDNITGGIIDVNRKTKIQPPRPGNQPAPLYALTTMGGGRVIDEGPDALRRGDGGPGLPGVGGPPITGGARPGVVAPPQDVTPLPYDPTKPVDPMVNRPPDYDAFEAWRNASGRRSGAAGMDDYQFFNWLKNKGEGDLNTADPENFAAWASVQGPEFYAVNRNDADAYRANPQGMSFADWYRAGNRGQAPAPAAAVPPPSTTAPPLDIGNGLKWDQDRGGYYAIVDGKRQWYKSAADGSWIPWAREEELATDKTGLGTNWTPQLQGQRKPWGPSTTLNGVTTFANDAPPPAPVAAAPPPVSGGGAPNPPPVGGDTGNPAYPNFTDGLQSAIATLRELRAPQDKRDLDELQKRLVHQAANSGAINAGGFTQQLGSALGGLLADKNAQFSGDVKELLLNNSQLAAQRYGQDLAAAVQREGIRTNADLERFLADKQDILERYKTDQATKLGYYSADKQLDASSIAAAASGAAADRAAQANFYAAQLGYRGDLFRGDITREGQWLDFIGQYGQNAVDWMRLFLGADPFGGLTGMQPPGDVVVKT